MYVAPGKKGGPHTIIHTPLLDDLDGRVGPHGHGDGGNGKTHDLAEHVVRVAPLMMLWIRLDARRRVHHGRIHGDGCAMEEQHGVSGDENRTASLPSCRASGERA